VSTGVGARFWFESGLALLAAGLAVLTLLFRDWVELVFEFDPDRHSGSFEWSIVGASSLLAVVFALLARVEWRRAAAAR
jgi:hypothetical protein